MPRDNKIADKIYIDAEGNEKRTAHPEAVALLFKFSDGDTVTVDPSKLGQDVLKCATFHGLSQALGDSYSGAEGNVDTAKTLLNARLETFMSGKWANVGEGGGGRVTILAEALHRAKPDKYATVQDAIAAVGEWDSDKKKGARKLLAGTIAEIEAERAAEKVKKATNDEDALAEL